MQCCPHKCYVHPHPKQSIFAAFTTGEQSKMLGAHATLLCCPPLQSFYYTQVWKKKLASYIILKPYNNVMSCWDFGCKYNIVEFWGLWEIGRGNYGFSCSKLFIEKFLIDKSKIWLLSWCIDIIDRNTRMDWRVGFWFRGKAVLSSFIKKRGYFQRRDESSDDDKIYMI